MRVHHAGGVLWGSRRPPVQAQSTERRRRWVGVVAADNFGREYGFSFRRARWGCECEWVEMWVGVHRGSEDRSLSPPLDGSTGGAGDRGVAVEVMVRLSACECAWAGVAVDSARERLGLCMQTQAVASVAARVGIAEADDFPPSPPASSTAFGREPHVPQDASPRKRGRQRDRQGWFRPQAHL